MDLLSKTARVTTPSTVPIAHAVLVPAVGIVAPRNTPLVPEGREIMVTVTPGVTASPHIPSGGHKVARRMDPP